MYVRIIMKKHMMQAVDVQHLIGIPIITVSLIVKKVCSHSTATGLLLILSDFNNM